MPEDITQVLLRVLLPIGLIGLIALILLSEKLRGAVIQIFFILVMLGLVLVPAFMCYVIVTLPPDQLLANQESFKSVVFDSTPFILTVGILSVVILLILLILSFSPEASEALRRLLHLHARRRYLASLLKAFEPQVATLAMVVDQATIDEWWTQPPLPKNLIVRGAPGTGKSTLLRQVLVAMTRQTLSGDSKLLPVFIDMDLVTELAIPLPGRGGTSTYLQGGADYLTNWMLRREAEQQKFCFVVDGSISLNNLSSIKNAHTLKHLYNELVKFMQDHANCTVVLALPSQAAESLDFRFPDRLSLDSLSNTQVQEVIKGILGETRLSIAQTIYQTIQADRMWLSLARKPFILSLIVKYYAHKGHTPKDLVELFRETSYPRDESRAEDVEAFLSQLAFRMANENCLSLPIKELDKIAKEATTIPVPREMVRRLVRSGILMLLRGGKQGKAIVKFKHPLYMAFFLALAWRDGLVLTSNRDAIEDFARDPLRGEALVFFNNLGSDTARFEDQLRDLTNRNDLFSLALAINCALARPESSTSISLIKWIAFRLIQRLSDFDEQSAKRSWLFLENCRPEERLEIYSQALSGMEKSSRRKTLLKIASLAIEELQAIFRGADATISEAAGMVWIELNPAEALDEFRGIYSGGPDAKRHLAVEMMGYLKGANVADTLYSFLDKETTPQLRVAILRSLYRSGSPSILRMLDIIVNAGEADEVRAAAAEILARSGSRDLESESAIGNIVRATRGQISIQMRAPLEGLLKHLRSVRPDIVEKCEALINPYLAGREVEDETMFFGRNKLMNELMTNVGRGNHVLIHGERRIGKTTMLKQLLKQLRKEQNESFPVVATYLDLQGVSEHEFYPTVIQAIIQQASPQGLDVTGIPRSAQYGYWEFNEDFSRIIEQLKHTKGKNVKLVLIWDEVDQMLDYPQQMLARLRRTLSGEHSRQVVLVFAGVNPIPKWALPVSPFYGMFQMYSLGPFTLEDAKALIKEPIASTCDYDDEAIVLILKYSQCKPHKIQSICHKVVNYALLQGKRRVTADDVRHEIESQDHLRIDLAAQIDLSLGSLLSWSADNPQATQAQMEEQLEGLWKQWRELLLQTVGDRRGNQSTKADQHSL